MRFWIPVLLLLLHFSASAQNRSGQVMLQAEDSVHNIISSLPEVKALDGVYDSLSNRMQKLVLKITPPDDAVRYYYIEAGYQGGTRFHPHYYFYVDLANQIIYIEDMEYGDRPILEEWRKRRAEKNTTEASTQTQ